MIEAEDFFNPAAKLGYDFYTGVPCSFLSPFINAAITSEKLSYVGAASEGEAVGIAAGAWLAGRKTVVMCQNSGLGNTVNPITSLNYPFRIPTLIITTWRGEPGLADEPQHELMGEITQDLLDIMRISHNLFPDEFNQIRATLKTADEHMAKEGLSYALVMKKNSVRAADIKLPALIPEEKGVCHDRMSGNELYSRSEMLMELLRTVPESAAVISTTGKCGRELFTLKDREQHIYQVGSMGCASAMGLGVALNTKRPVVVLDGDGAALMKLGSMATIGAAKPDNLVHILLDNGVHDSTGGQATVSSGLSFIGIAYACGYAFAVACNDPDEFRDSLVQALSVNGPSFIHIRITPGSMKNLGRPKIKPADVAKRFKSFLAKPID